MTTTSPSITRSPNRGLGITIGALYLFLGIVGFFWSTGVPFAGQGSSLNNMFGLFALNPLQGFVHLLLAAALLIAGLSTAASARSANATVGVIFLLLGVVGFFLAAPDGGQSPVNVLYVNLPDQILHLATGFLLVVTALGADRHLPPERPVQVA